MQVTINTLSPVEQEADIQVTNEELQPHFQRAYEKYRPKVEIRGFRKGRAPMDMIKKLYGESIEHEALDTIAGEFYQKAMDEQNIQPLGQPSMTNMEFKRGEHFRFRIKYEIRPPIELKQYKGVAVEKQVHRVTDKEIEQEVEHLRRSHSTTTEVQSVTDPRHIVTADVQELDTAGTPLIGRKTSGARFALDDQTLAQEIRDALSKAETGNTYKVSFESQHGDHAHTVHLSIAVTKIEKVTLPEFDDAFVEKITGGKTRTRDEFLNNMRSDLKRYWEDQANRKLSDDLVSEVIKEHEFPVPSSVVEGFLDSFVDDIKSKSKDRKLPRDFDEKKFREESRAYAVWQAKWLLLKERIAEAEGITVADEELEKLAETDATQLGIGKDRLLQYYRSSSTARDRLLTEKILAFLRANAKIAETEEKQA